MELQLNRPGQHPHVRHVDGDTVTVFDETLRCLEHSFIITPERLIEDWAVTDADGLTDADIDPILALKPEVVILGTGRSQIFPPTRIMAAFLQRGVGLEPMENHAAARTHTILAGEDRHVVTAFILPGSSAGH